MTVVAIVYEPDPDLGPDPLDEAKQPRRLGELLDMDRQDVLVVWREYGDQFVDGVRTHIVSSGSWENITDEQRDQIIAWLDEASL